MHLGKARLSCFDCKILYIEPESNSLELGTDWTEVGGNFKLKVRKKIRLC